MDNLAGSTKASTRRWPTSELSCAARAPFLALSPDQQQGWAEFLFRRLNPSGGKKARTKALEAAQTEWSLSPAAVDKLSIRAALRTQAQINIPYVPWRCTGFDEDKLGEWEAAVARRRRFARMFKKDVPADQEFLEACKEAANKPKRKRVRFFSASPSFFFDER